MPTMARESGRWSENRELHDATAQTLARAGWASGAQRAARREVSAVLAQHHFPAEFGELDFLCELDSLAPAFPRAQQDPERKTWTFSLTDSTNAELCRRVTGQPALAVAVDAMWQQELVIVSTGEVYMVLGEDVRAMAPNLIGALNRLEQGYLLGRAPMLEKPRRRPTATTTPLFAPVQAALHRAGWDPDRRVDASAAVQRLRRRGAPIHDCAVPLMRQFLALRVPCRWQQRIQRLRLSPSLAINLLRRRDPHMGRVAYTPLGAIPAADVVLGVERNGVAVAVRAETPEWFEEIADDFPQALNRLVIARGSDCPPEQAG
jgi:hypothetical protein